MGLGLTASARPDKVSQGFSSNPEGAQGVLEGIRNLVLLRTLLSLCFDQ